jgi:hypothetical protein
MHNVFKIHALRNTNCSCCGPHLCSAPPQGVLAILKVPQAFLGLPVVVTTQVDVQAAVAAPAAAEWGSE